MPEFSQKLNAWYRRNSRPLPWRETKDPYKIWISEIMLQQTTVSAVIPYYQRWVKTFPTVEDVARADIQKILTHWQGLGYYSRAKNIHRAAQLIVEQFDAKIPQTVDTLKQLPGFGPYTVGALLSIAFDQRVPIIDANVRRVVMRQLALKGIADIKQDAKIHKFLDFVMPQKNLRTFNQALMELGALVCRSQQPLCLNCPVRCSCKAYTKGWQEIIPTPKKRITQSLEVAIAVIKKNNKYLLQKRSPKGLLADLWEFPGGKIEENETPLEAVKREVQEEIGCALKSAVHLMKAQHFYTQFRVNLHVFECELSTFPKTSETRKWLTINEFKQYPMPSGSVKIVDRLHAINS